MSGFPSIPTRSSFGPVRRNARPIRNPETELGADEINLTFWQAAGASHTVPLGVIIYDPNAIPGEQVKFQGLAFDPYRKLPNILPTVNATGDFVWSFESSYPDQRGVSVPWLPKGAVAMPQSSSPGVEAGVTVAGNTVRVETQDASDTPIDVAFILLIW